MKFTKLSLVAALAMSAAFAGGDIEPVAAPGVESPFTFGGHVKAFYDTTDHHSGYIDEKNLFAKENSAAQIAVDVDMSYSFADTWKVNFGATGLTTLGIEGYIVNNVWLAADNTEGGPGVGDALWIDTFNVTGTAWDGKATFVLGRQELDTPLAFTETWTIANNTFDAAVAMVKPIDELTLVAGYIYDGNGNTIEQGPVKDITTFRSHPGGFTGDAGYFPLFTDTNNEISNGAWTVAAIGTIAGVTAQAWYYDVMDVAQAVWVQADADFSGFTIGGQYAWLATSGKLDDLIGDKTEDSSAFAGKIGYKMDAFEAWAAYSSVDDVANGKTAIPVANTATMLSNAGWGNQSKLYTEAWWNYGLVGQAGADTFGAALSYNVGDLAMFNGISLLGQYTSVSHANPFLSLDGSTVDMDEFTALVGATAYGLNVQLAYINTDYSAYDALGATNDAESYNSDEVQLYLTYSF